MSALEAQVIESLEGLSDDNLTFLLNVIDKYIKSKSVPYTQHQFNGGIKIGMFKGEKYIADEYDFDENNDEIAKLLIPQYNANYVISV